MDFMSIHVGSVVVAAAVAILGFLFKLMVNDIKTDIKQIKSDALAKDTWNSSHSDLVKRVDRLFDEHDKIKNEVVWVDRCVECRKLTDVKADQMIKNQARIEEKLDQLADRQIAVLVNLGLDPKSIKK